MEKTLTYCQTSSWSFGVALMATNWRSRSYGPQPSLIVSILVFSCTSNLYELIEVIAKRIEAVDSRQKSSIKESGRYQVSRNNNVARVQKYGVACGEIRASSLANRERSCVS